MMLKLSDDTNEHVNSVGLVRVPNVTSIMDKFGKQRFFYHFFESLEAVCALTQNQVSVEALLHV